MLRFCTISSSPMLIPLLLGYIVLKISIIDARVVVMGAYGCVKPARENFYCKSN